MSTVKAINLQHPTSSNVNIVLDSGGKVSVGTGNTAYSALEITATSAGWGEGLVINPSSSGYSAIFWRREGTSGANTSGTWSIGKNVNGGTPSNEYLQVLKESLSGSALDRGDLIQKWHVNGDSSFGFRVLKPAQPAFWITNFVWSSSVQRPSNGTVWTNVGGHYNNTTGVFTAPISGYYMFTCTVQGNNPGETSGRNATYFNLKANKNGIDLGNEIVATAADVSGKHDQITHTAIVNLSTNDTFYFASNYGFRVVQNTYTGYLLG